MRYEENPRDAAVSLGQIFPKKKHVFRYGLGECVYQISGLYRFSFGQDKTTEWQTHIYTSELKRTHSPGFWFTAFFDIYL